MFCMHFRNGGSKLKMELSRFALHRQMPFHAFVIHLICGSGGHYLASRHNDKFIGQFAGENGEKFA